MVALLLQSRRPKGAFAVPVSAPSAIEQMAQEKGCSVRRTKSSERSMIEAALSPEVVMAGVHGRQIRLPEIPGRL